MQYWPWWLSATILGAVPLLHWLLLKRTLAVSGRFTAIVDRLRASGRQEEQGETMSLEEMAEALRDMVATEYGEDALEAQDDAAAAPVIREPQTTSQHLVFFVGLAAGGVVSAVLASTLTITPGLRAELFSELAHTPGAAMGLLFGGGLLVGFGTRMAGGCTSGHGLCGVSRFQTGSMVATAAFFGMGIVVSFLLGGVL
jgi:uncharacterized protein